MGGVRTHVIHTENVVNRTMLLPPSPSASSLLACLICPNEDIESPHPAGNSMTRQYGRGEQRRRSTRRQCATPTYEDGRDLLPHQPGGRGHVVVGEEVQQMLDVLHPQRQADADAEGTVVVHVQRGEFRSNDASIFFSGGGGDEGNN